MNGRQKVYVIEPARDAAVASPAAAGELPEYLRPAGEETSRKVSGSRKDRASGAPLILSYMTGPLAILATAAGRGSRAWTAASLLGAGSAVATAWLWTSSPWPRMTFPAAAAMIVAASAAVFLCCAAWTRAIVLAGKTEARRMRRSPKWLRSRVSAGLMGSVVPGMGLFVAGHPTRAAAAVWVAGLAGVAAATLSKAGRLWEMNRFAGSPAVDAAILERVFIVAAGVAAAGAVTWIVQALDGIRLAGDRTHSVPRGSAFSLALIAALVLMAATFDASVVAAALDRGASAAATRGMREIPFHLARTAAALDPSRPAYACRAIEMGERCGRRDFAERARADLLRRLEPAVSLLEKAGIVAAAGANSGEDRESAKVAPPPLELALHGDRFPGALP